MLIRRRSRPRAWARLVAPLMLVVGSATAACRHEDEQRRLCQGLLAAFEPYPASIQIQRVEIDPIAPNEVLIEYLSRDRDRRVGKHWLVCGFSGGGWRGEPLELTKVITDRRGVLNPTQLQMLKIWQRLVAAHGSSPALTAADGFAATTLLLARSDVGRRHRTCCDGGGMAGIIGINTARVAAVTVGLSGVGCSPAQSLVAS